MCEYDVGVDVFVGEKVTVLLQYCAGVPGTRGLIN